MKDGKSNTSYQQIEPNVTSNSDPHRLTSTEAETLLTSMDDLVFLLDEQRNFVKNFVSDTSRLLMLPHLFLGKNISEVPFPGEAMRIINSAFDAAERNGLTQTIDYNLPINEETRWYNAKISVLPSGGFIVVARDTTTLTESIRLLEENERKYHLLADNVIDLIGLHDIEGAFEYVSPSSLAVLGYTPEELIGKNAFDLIHPDESKKLFEKTSALFQKGIETYIEEFRILHKNGHYVYFETTGKIIGDDENQRKKFLTTSRDITEWKQAQFALKESEEKYRSLVEGADNLIIMIDCNSRYLFANSAAAKIVGTTPENMIGKVIGEISSSSNADFFKANAQVCIVEKRVVRVEHMLEINGSKYFLRTSFNPIRNAERSVYAVLINAIDITNLKNTEALLEQQNKDLKEIAFLQSHVLRSPLSNIKHLISLLDKQSLSEENKILFDLIKTSTDNLDDVVRQIVEKTYLPEKKD